MAPIQTVKDWVMCQYARKSVKPTVARSTFEALGLALHVRTSNETPRRYVYVHSHRASLTRLPHERYVYNIPIGIIVARFFDVRFGVS